MSATATATATSQSVAEWVKIFPRQVTETYTSSVTFMKQLTVVAVSTITYLKNVFPEESFTVEHFGGIKLRILKKKCRDELAQFVSTALTQAFEAFDKKYLHQLALCFYDGECKVDNIIEYHIFEYSYNEDGVTMNVHSKNRDNVKQSTKYDFDNIKERTIHLIRAFVVIMDTCPNELPESYDVSLRLYYNEDAPAGYQAPGFVPAQEEGEREPLAATRADRTRLGWVATPFHRVLASSYIRDIVGSSHEAIPSQNPPVISQNEQDEFDSVADSAPSVSGSSGPQVRCPCNKYDFDDVMLTCQYCKTAQHAACFGVRRARAARGLAWHACHVCADADSTRRLTDTRLLALSRKNRECLSIFRRALDVCSRSSSLSANTLVDKLAMSPSNAAKLMKLLHTHGIVTQDPDSEVATFDIIPDQVKRVMGSFFQTDETDIVERLIAETVSPSTSRQPDPLGDVLGPLEKVSLHNATTLGRTIQPTPPKAVEDSTLKQYREAILSNEKIVEELPLSGSHNPVKDVERIGMVKRKMDTEDRPNLRSGSKTKRVKTTN